jgi:NitT/TauT family transport system substrate-binding protein
MSMSKLYGGTSSRKPLAIVVALAVIALLVPALHGCASEEDPLHVRMAVAPYLSFTPFYICQAEGYFEEQGIEVEFVTFPSSTQAIPLLAQGDLDVVATTLNAGLINAINMNANLRIVAGRNHVPYDCEYAALMVATDLYESGEVDTVAELDGRRVAVPLLASLVDYELEGMLETGGLDLGSVDVMKLAPQDTIAAFGNNGIDAAVVGNPQNEQIKELGYAVTLISADQVRPGFSSSFVMYGPNLLDKDPEVGNRFMAAYFRGARQYAEGKTERNIEIALQYTSLDESTVDMVCWEPIHTDGRIQVEDLLVFQDWADEQGYIDEKLGSDQLVDTRFIDYANEILGP